LFVSKFQLLAHDLNLQQSKPTGTPTGAATEHGETAPARWAAATATTARLTLRLSHCYRRETQAGDDRQATEKLETHGELLRCCLNAASLRKRLPDEKSAEGGRCPRENDLPCELNPFLIAMFRQLQLISVQFSAEVPLPVRQRVFIRTARFCRWCGGRRR
jgi:hypothetical protein